MNQSGNRKSVLAGPPAPLELPTDHPRSAAQDRLPVLDESERHKLLYDFNATTVEFPNDTCVHQMFEEQAARTPDAVAVIFKGTTLSYSELNRRANRLAHFLRDLGVRPDKPVAICTQRSSEMVIALMAVLKAGGAYVPLDPAYPVERLLFMLRDSEPVALLTQQDLAAKFAGCEAKTPFIDLTGDSAKWDSLPDSNPDPLEIELNSSHLAYVIYTSGSTGKPKGVEMPHRALVNLIHWQIRQPGFSQSKRIMQFAALGFDVSFQETASALCSGRTLVLSEEEGLVNPANLLNFIGENEIHEVFLPYAMLSLLADGIGESAEGIRSGGAHREIITAGEQLRISPGIRSLFQNLPDCRLQNQYGPTETHVVTSFMMPRDVGEWPILPPIGRPIANAQIYILDPSGQPVPIGVMGEIYVGGVCVARGYLNRPELTAERFVPDTFSSQSGARMYRTGDLGRWTPDGNVEYLGRSDFQVKIRGFRVELGEIETRLAEYPGIGETVVVAREDNFGNKRLVAYYTTSRGASRMNSSVGAEQLRAHLLAVLPEHMIPVAFVHMPSLPLSPNGKLDRKALPAPEIDAYATSGYEAPQGEIEIKLAGIWSDLLNVDRVGRHDNFFWLGGDSILSVKMIARAQQEGLNLNLGAMMASQTISELAAAATELSNTRAKHAISRSALPGEAWDDDRVEIEI
jgi:amino acid adenylation domain-containing protein